MGGGVATQGGGSSYFITGFGIHLTQSAAEVTPAIQFQRTKHFLAVAENLHVAGLP